jgi:anthranilate phosphoribosyltransferase
MSDFTKLLKRIVHHSDIDEETIYNGLNMILQGDATQAQIGAFATATAMHDIDAGQIAGAARALRRNARTVQAPDGAADCCGTGGDNTGTLNISTAVAFVAAACEVPMAKHGNRAASSKSGAGDVLEALGMNIEADHDVLERALNRLGFCFLMAPRHHPALASVAAVRKELGFRTIFNLLGPLINPANARYQLIGVYDDALRLPVARALARLGTKRAWIVHGRDGMDEISTTTESDVTCLENGEIYDVTLSPEEDFGLERATLDDLQGGSAQDNAGAIEDLLEGRHSAYREIVLANASALLVVADKAGDLRDGMARAARAIDNGDVARLVHDYRQMVNSE